MVTKTTLVGKMPVKFQFGVEYSVVSQDAYGEQAKLVLEVIPVIPALIRRSILGGCEHWLLDEGPGGRVVGLITS
jgi:hypothetical protein